MKISLSKKEDVLSVLIDGEIDHHSAVEIKTKVDSYITGSNVKYVMMDFSKVGFMDSSGIGMVMGRFKNIKRVGGELYIVAPSPSVKRILDMSGIAGVIPVLKGVQEFLEVIK